MHELQRSFLRFGLPGWRSSEDCAGPGHLRSLEVHGMPLLHGRLPVQRSQIRMGESCSRKCRNASCAPIASRKASRPRARRSAPPAPPSLASATNLIAEAQQRIHDNPGKYVNHIYGLEEVGGTSVLLLSSVPFETFGYRTDISKDPMPMLTYRVLSHIPDFVPLGGMVLGGVWWITHRREEVALAEGRDAENEQEEWRKAIMARATTFRLTFWKLVFLFLMAAGLYATFIRFTQGLGASTQPERSVSLGHLDQLRRALRRDAGGRRIHAHRCGSHSEHQAPALDHSPDDSDRIPRIRPGLRGADVRPGQALQHLASADHAESALGDV